MKAGWWVLVLLAGLLALPPERVRAAGDPVGQCQAGVKLFHEYRDQEARESLEAAFADWETAAFEQLDDAGTCTLTLGLLRNQGGDYRGGLTALQAALDIFEETGNRDGEENTLYNIGVAYHSLGQYGAALDKYRQALTISRETGDRAGEGTILNNISLVYQAQGRPDAALESFQQALALSKEVGDRLAEGTILNNIGLINQTQGRLDAALDNFQQALTLSREIEDRLSEGTILANIGSIYQTQGQMQPAAEAYQQALAISRETGDQAGEGSLLSSLGAIYQTQGRYQSAQDHFQQALALGQKTGDQALVATALNHTGLLYRVQGRYDDALAAYQQVLALVRQLNNRTGESSILANIGDVYQAQGRYGEALENYQQALVIARHVNYRAGEGTILNNIGLVYKIQRRYGDALSSYQQALAILRETGNRVTQATTLNNIGLIYEQLGQYDEALSSLEDALRIRRQVGDRAGEGVTLNNMGLVYERQGEYGAAQDTYRQALAIRREVGNRAWEGVTLNNLGNLYRLQGRDEQALATLRQALAIQREVGDRAGTGETLASLGRLYQSQGLDRQALDSYQQAIALFETVRAEAGSDSGRAGYIAGHIDTYQAAIGLLHHLGRDEDAFFTSEQARGRAFLDTLATGQTQLSDNDAANLLRQAQEAYAVWQAGQDRLAEARAADPPDPATIAELETQVDEAGTAFAGLQAAIAARHDQLAGLVPGRSQNVIDLPAVQTLLDEQTTLLSYFVLPENVLAFLVTRNDFQTVLLDVSQNELATQINALRDFADLNTAHPANAVTLYKLLIAPLKDKLTTSQLAIIPHQQLHYLPFAALTDGEQYLIDAYRLTVLPSASALPFILENAGKQKNAGGGEPPGNSPALVIGNPTTAAFDTVASLATTRDQLGALPYAEKEAKAIAALFGVEPLIGPAATESAVRAQVGRAGLLHLAAHGQFDPASPLNSLIALAPDDKNDGWLTVGEAYGLDLKNTDLVVLSACETNLGDLSAGDELVGLTRALIFAGAPSVIASLWAVEDEATARLMERFYTHLQAGRSKAEALRQAQIEVRTDYPNPYYWSGFVLSGDAGERGPGPGPGEAPDGPVEFEPMPKTPTAGQCFTLLWVLGLVTGLGMMIRSD